MSNSSNGSPATVSRRTLLSVCTAAGLGQTLFPGALLALASPQAAGGSGARQQGASSEDLHGWPAITPAMIDAAAVIAAVHITDEQKQMMLDGVLNQRNNALRVRDLHLANGVAPVAMTNPIPAGTTPPPMEPQQPLRLGPALRASRSSSPQRRAQPKTETLQTKPGRLPQCVNSAWRCGKRKSPPSD